MGIQLVIWTISGFYMVVVDIDIIHGDHLVLPTAELSAEQLKRFSATASKLANSNQEYKAITLKSLGDRAVIELNTPNETQLIDALSSQPLALIDAESVRRLAKTYYAGTGEIKETLLIDTEPPGEIGARALPIWRVDFDDLWGSTLYIFPTTGALATRRHTLWRVFDFLWMLHIMDYDEREDINNTLLRIVSLLAFLMVLSGVWYLYFRLNVKSWFARGKS